MNQYDFFVGGKTYEPEKDKERLQSQFKRVKELMLDGRWRTLYEIQEKCGGSSASISARLRDMRKKRFGEYNVERKRLYDGIFIYRVLERLWS